MKEYHVHTGRPSWHQARAGHRSAGITVCTTRVSAERYRDAVLKMYPSEPAFIVEVETNPAKEKL